MFSLVDTPMALPGSCYLCGSGDKSPYIDWGVSVEFYGALYTCSECTASVASLLGMVSREQHATLIQQLDQLSAENSDLQKKNFALKQVIESLNIVGVDEPVPVTDDQLSLPSLDPELDLLASDQTTDEESRSTDEFLDFGTGTSDESSDDERVDELRSVKSKSERKYTI